MGILRDVTPLVEAISLDEAFLDTTGATRRLGTGPRSRAALRRPDPGRDRPHRVRRCRHHEALAKLASDLAKPDGHARRRARHRDRLPRAPRRRTRLWGVGPATRRRLERLGVRTVGDLATIPEDTLASGRSGRPAAHTSTRSPATRTTDRWSRRGPRSRSATRRRSPPTSRDRATLEVTSTGSPSASPLACARSASSPGRCVLKARYGDFRTITRSRTVPEPTDLADELAAVGRELLPGSTSRGGLRLLGLSAQQLVAVSADTQPRLPLGDAPGPDRAARRRPGARGRRRAAALRRRRRPAAPRARRRRVTVRVGIVGCGLIGFIHSYTLHLLIERGRRRRGGRGHLRRRPGAGRGVRRRPRRRGLCRPRRARRPGRCRLGLHLDGGAPRRRHGGGRSASGPSSARSRSRRRSPTASASPRCSTRSRTRSASCCGRRPYSRPSPSRCTADATAAPSRWCSVTTSTSRPRASTRRSGAPTCAAPAAGRCSSTPSTTSTSCAGCWATRRRVRAWIASRFGHPGIDDVAAVTLTFADEAVATLTSVWHQVLSRGSSRRVEVFCERALLWLDDDHTGPLHVETEAGTEVVPTRPPAWVTELDVPPGPRPGRRRVRARHAGRSWTRSQRRRARHRARRRGGAGRAPGRRRRVPLRPPAGKPSAPPAR